MTQERTDWTAIGKLLNTLPGKYRNKWMDIQVSKLKHSALPAEEDALIRQRVAEWWDKEKV